MAIVTDIGTGYANQWNSGGGGGRLQQIWLPRSVLKNDQTNFYKIQDYASTTLSMYPYAASFVDGNLIYIRNGTTISIYNMITNSWESNITNLPGWNGSQRDYYIRIGRKVYIMTAMSVYFGYLDLDLRVYVPLSFPALDQTVGGTPKTFSVSSANNLVGLALRYDSLYNKIYAIIPYTYYSGSQYVNGAVAVYVYDIASNTWVYISSSANGSSTNSSYYRGKGYLIDFTDTQVKFLYNNGVTGYGFSLTINRNNTPTSGSNAWQSEGTFTFLACADTANTALTACSIIQTDDKVFGIKGNKIFTFNLFTGEVSETNLFGAVPVATIFNNSSQSYSAATNYGVSYDNGKLYFASNNQVWAMDYIQSIQPGGPLAFKIFAGQKYSSFKPITIRKVDGTEYLIDQTVRVADQDIEIRVGEYDNTQEMTYLLIEN